MSLMVLLMVLAVALLSLSSIELRSSGSNTAMAQAKANARLALQIAIGELQLQAGPDTRITATSDVVGGKNRYTGVWNSRALDPKSPGALYEDKSTAFRKWLVSNPNIEATKSQDFVKDSVTDPVALVSEKTLGQSSTGNTDQIVQAGRVPLLGSNSGKATGHYAYATMDDAVKARVDLGDVSVASGDKLAQKTTALGLGQSPGIDRITGISKPAGIFDISDPESAGGKKAVNTLNKIVSLNQADLGYGADGGTFGERFHDLTTDSLGLLVDVAKGGFKRDLNLMAESATPPAEYAGIGIYNKAFGSVVPVAADPTWGEALGYARLFNDTNRMVNNNGVPSLKAYVPQDWKAATPGTADTRGNIPFTLNTTPPNYPVLLPSIAKVQVVFSFGAQYIWKTASGAPPLAPPMLRLSRLGPGHDGYDPGKDADKSKTPEIPAVAPVRYPGLPTSRYRYSLRLIYTPVVTLHNPYNVPIQFDQLRVSFKNVPFAMQVKVDDVPQYKDYANFAQYLSANEGFNMTATNSVGRDKIFGFNISTGRLMPGEVKIYSPNVPGMENFNYGDGGDARIAGTYSNTFYDTGIDDMTLLNRRQEFIAASEGWRGPQYGFVLDQLNAGSISHGIALKDDDDGQPLYARGGYIPLKPGSNVSADIAPIPDSKISDIHKFSVEMRLQTQARGATVTTPPVAIYEFDYGTTKGLQDSLFKDLPNKAVSVGPFPVLSMVDKWDVKLKDWKGLKPFAIFSAYAKTTHARENGTNEDGAYAAKPWSLNNHTGPVGQYNLVTGIPAAQSHEINLQALQGNIDDAFTSNLTGQSKYVTGHMAATGRIAGTFHDIPLAPLQSIKDLNGANLAALATSPHFAAPLGNSFAHSMMSTSDVVSGNLVDHSYLLNSIFYDQFYCSGIQSDNFLNTDAKQLGNDFLSGAKPLGDRRFLPYFADGITLDSAEDKLKAADGYKNAASMMLMKGAFNVNSTSVEAWKAVLSSMSGKNAMAFAASTGATSAIADPSDAKGARFSRFRLPNTTTLDDADAYWQGVVDLDEKQLTSLAEAIVVQIKERGPFLSLGEFVNRQVGRTDEKTLSGALQAAITNSNVNSKPPADSGGNEPGYEISEDLISKYGLATPKALAGPSAQGAPGFLTQADILGVIGNAATVRADTFTIRAYGDSVDSNGKILAKAYCEVIVQRMPEYCNPVDAATANPPTDASNLQFGRRFTVRSFRWLSPDEV
jgi:hypothetical protein